MANKSCPIAVDVMFHTEDKEQGRFKFFQRINEIGICDNYDSKLLTETLVSVSVSPKLFEFTFSFDRT